MLRFLVPVYVTAALLAIGASPAVAKPRPAASCTNVSGTVSGFAIPVIGSTGLVGFNVTLTSGTGPLAGSATAALTIERLVPGGAMHLSGTHTYSTSPYGQLTLSDRINVTPEGRVHNTSEVISGGSGFLVSHGTINLTSGALALRYHGRICSA